MYDLEADLLEVITCLSFSIGLDAQGLGPTFNALFRSNVKVVVKYMAPTPLCQGILGDLINFSF